MDPLLNNQPTIRLPNFLPGNRERLISKSVDFYNRDLRSLTVVGFFLSFLLKGNLGYLAIAISIIVTTSEE